MITEPDVTLTDYLVAVESALFAYLLSGHGGQLSHLGFWFAVFFGSISVAGITGGTVHGFFLDTDTLGYRLLWPITLMAIGVTALSAWVIGARIYFSPKIAVWITIGAVALFAGYCVAVLFVTQNFFIAVVHYLPSTVFLSMVFLLVFLEAREPQVLIGLLGLLLTFIAAGVQQGGLSIHPTYFNHNALYHLIQAVALLMIFWTARWWVTPATH